ncbi:hypothetical protein N9X66_07425 [Gammaproteobacteria bacterium]|nr:hypothetical protein [Gammaproteobacteria bacterium]
MVRYTTLGGRVTCTQCSGLSKRTRQRCGNPAMKGKKVCRHHGGKSTGARTPEGKARQIEANTIHGNETRAKREERKQTNAELYALEKEMRRLGMVEGAWVNRKPPSK